MNKLTATLLEDINSHVNNRSISLEELMKLGYSVGTEKISVRLGAKSIDEQPFTVMELIGEPISRDTQPTKPDFCFGLNTKDNIGFIINHPFEKYQKLVG